MYSDLAIPGYRVDRHAAEFRRVERRGAPEGDMDVVRREMDAPDEDRVAAPSGRHPILVAALCAALLFAGAAILGA